MAYAPRVMGKILTVATSAQTLVGSHKTGLWLAELTHFLEVIVDAGFDYDIASPSGGKVPLDEKSAGNALLKDPVNARFMNDPKFVEKLEHSLRCSDVDAAAYVAIFLAGGHGTMFDFRQSPELQRLITDFYSSARPVSGVCHGVAALVDCVDQHGNFLVKGKTVTGFSNFEDSLAGAKKHMPFLLESSLRERGAIYKKSFLPFSARVEVDGLVITGQNPKSARGVGLKLVEQLRA